MEIDDIPNFNPTAEIFDARSRLMETKERCRDIVDKKMMRLAKTSLIRSVNSSLAIEGNCLEPYEVADIIDIAKQAMQDVDVKPQIVPIRGGTDGARLSFMGLPAPNLFTGGHHFHGRYEYIPVESMEKAVQVIVRIAELCTKI